MGIVADDFLTFRQRRLMTKLEAPSQKQQTQKEVAKYFGVHPSAVTQMKQRANRRREEFMRTLGAAPAQ